MFLLLSIGWWFSRKDEGLTWGLQVLIKKQLFTYETAYYFYCWYGCRGFAYVFYASGKYLSVSKFIETENKKAM
jgi:hypothetical protein